MDSSHDLIGIVMPKSGGVLIAHIGVATMKNTTIAVNIAKSAFEIAVLEQQGRVSERHRLSRTGFLRYFAQREPSTGLLEACGPRITGRVNSKAVLRGRPLHAPERLRYTTEPYGSVSGYPT